MKITIKGTHMDITPEIQEYLEKRLKVVEKFLDDESLIEAGLGRTTNHHKTGDVFIAELNVMVHGDLVRAGSERSDLYTAIDDARDELSNILSSRKGKREALWKRGGQKLKKIIRGIKE